jgi:hypothetical protein
MLRKGLVAASLRHATVLEGHLRMLMVVGIERRTKPTLVWRSQGWKSGAGAGESGHVGTAIHSRATPHLNTNPLSPNSVSLSSIQFTYS